MRAGLDVLSGCRQLPILQDLSILKIVPALTYSNSACNGVPITFLMWQPRDSEGRPSFVGSA